MFTILSDKDESLDKGILTIFLVRKGAPLEVRNGILELEPACRGSCTVLAGAVTAVLILCKNVSIFLHLRRSFLGIGIWVVQHGFLKWVREKLKRQAMFFLFLNKCA